MSDISMSDISIPDVVVRLSGNPPIAAYIHAIASIIRA